MNAKTNVNSKDLTINPEVSVIVISYNTRELTLDCLRSVFHESDGLSLEVIVLDNASTDGSAVAIRTMFPQVNLFASSKNLGFAAGNNTAVEHAKGEWVILLNPDTVILRRGLLRLMEFARGRRGKCLIGGRSYFPDGRLNPTTCWGEPSLWSLFTASIGLAGVFKTSRLFDPESLGIWERDSVRAVPIIAGCLMAMRRSTWDLLGGFDPRFFMYGEDADLCMRARKREVELLICPDAEFVHYAGASERVPADKIVRLFCAKCQLYRKHWCWRRAWIAARMLSSHCLVRAAGYGLVGIVVTKRRESARQWIRAWHRRTEWQFPPMPADGIAGAMEAIRVNER